MSAATVPFAALPATMLLWLLAACAPESPVAPAAGSPRAGRFGSLRDFVLFDRIVDGRETSLFVDRFEVTRADWAEFAGTTAGRSAGADSAAMSGDPALPVGRVDLRQARAFARWRFARLPRSGEWTMVAVGDGRNRFPWGSKEDATRANTVELGLGEPTPVGTFESGRRSEGDQPYDLVGNVSEWTESVPWSWCLDDRLGDPPGSVLDPEASFRVGRLRSLRTPALSVWQGPGGTLPLACLVQAGGERVPREVVESDFQSPMAYLAENVLSGDRRLRTGLRICAWPQELLAALLAADVEATAADLDQVRRFVRRDQHREVLRRAWPRAAAATPPDARSRPVGRLLTAELGEPRDGAAADGR